MDKSTSQTSVKYMEDRKIKPLEFLKSVGVSEEAANKLTPAMAKNQSKFIFNLIKKINI